MFGKREQIAIYSKSILLLYSFENEDLFEK